MIKPKDIVGEIFVGAKKIAESKLCWELTDNSRKMLAQEIIHFAFKLVKKTQEGMVEEMIP